MILIEATFIGENGSVGFTRGQRYSLKISGLLVSPKPGVAIPYESLESFLRNWTDLERLYPKATPKPTPDRIPYVGEGADGCRRSAQIDQEEIDTLDRDDPRIPSIRESIERWKAQALALEAHEEVQG